MKTLPSAVPKASLRRVRGEERARIRFLEQADVVSVLEIEAPADRDVVRPVYSALFSLRTQVVHLESRLECARVVHRLGVVEFDGAPIVASRRVEIQSAIVSLTGQLFGDEVAYDEAEEPALTG